MSKILAIFGNVALYGQERSNIKVFDTIKNAGHDVFLLVNDYGFQWHLQSEIEAHGLTYKKIRYPWLPNKKSSLSFIFQCFKDSLICNYHFICEFRKYKPDYIHIANQSFFLTLLPILFFLKTPIIFRLGDQPVKRYFFERWLWLYLLKKVNHFVCISKFIAKELKEIKPDFDNYTVIYNIPPSRKAINQSDNIPEICSSMFTIVYVGQIEESKGVNMLFEAAKFIIKDHKDIRFVFTGQLHLSQFFETIRNDNTLKENPSQLIFTDKIQNIDGIYQIGNIHIAPSVFQEPLSNVVGEAKKNGLPSIVFPSGGLSELITHGDDGYICKEKTIDELIKAIYFYYNHREELCRQGLNAKKSLNTLGLTNNIFEKKWLTIYK